MSKHIFISHASADDAFVKELRVKLELHDLKVWVDSRNLRGGDQLKPEIEQAIKEASQVIVVLSLATINSVWVRKEVQLAEQVANESEEDYRVIPLMLPGIEPPALTMWFKEEPTGINIQMETGQLQEKLSDIFAALGEDIVDDAEPEKTITAKPIAELLLELSLPQLSHQEDGSFQLSSEARLEYIPLEPSQPNVKSKRFIFTSPIGYLEQRELSWYLEDYFKWTTTYDQERAKNLEAELPKWGKALYEQVIDNDVCREAIKGWELARDNTESVFSIRIDAEILADNTKEDSEEEKQTAQKQANIAASQLLSLPWELLHNGKSYLNEGANAVRVRRRLPNYTHQLPMLMQLPIRILLVSPRPEDKTTGYIDHRASAKPLVEAVASLSDLVELTVLTPATLPALEKELKRAKAQNTPYHVLHFDGHGVYDSQHGLGALCFEDPKDSNKLEKRAMQLVYAKFQQGNTDSEKNIANLLHDYRIPLVFLEACQTAQTDIDPNASVAASLIDEGVASVIAMSHSVLVKTASLFVTAFYRSLAQGQRVGQAVLDGQQSLKADSFRFPALGVGDLYLQDWFVPILYQEQHDPQLFEHIPSDKAESLSQQQQKAKLGHLPATPTHQFIGRSRQLLTLERLLENQSYAVVKGQGGIGKTTIAVELTRWLVESGRFDRCAFVSLEAYSHDKAVLDILGKQLVGEHYNSAEYSDLKQALQPIQRVLENNACLILLDNMESLLADSDNLSPVLTLLNQLLVGWGEGRTPTLNSTTTHVGIPSVTPTYGKHSLTTRLLFTSRESLPAPFDSKQREITLGELNKDDARKLIINVMAEQGLTLQHDDQGRTPEEVDALITAVNGHARALVLLAKELSIRGVTATTENLQGIMQKLEQQHPGERENSLFASLELSLQRLSAETRELIKGLAVLHDGGDRTTIAHILEIEAEAATPLCAELIQVGLAEEKPYTYLRLDPALPNYLALQCSAEQKQHYQQRWLEIMSQLVGFLYKQKFKDAKLASTLTQLELPNLIAFIRQLNQQLEAGQTEPETVTGSAGRIEQLVAGLDYPQALAEVVRIHQQAAKQLGDWSHALFESKRLSIERFLAQGENQPAYETAEKLLQQCEQAGAEAYAGADYDLPMANYWLGRVLNASGATAQALPYLQQAKQRCEALGERGAEAFSVMLTEHGDCLTRLGQLDDAVEVYQDAINRSEKLGGTRQVGVGKMQLATARLSQKNYPAALQGYHEALELFQQLNEPSAESAVWHQIGMVYSKQQQFEQAEPAYRQSLSIDTQQGDRVGEASSLGELANLYEDWNRLEQAVDYFQRAAALYSELGNKRFEGFARNNLANILIKLNRQQQARPEILRAIECKESFGHAATPWLAWYILHNLEQKDGNPQAAAQARQKAIQTYVDYRRDGGENHSGTGRLALDVLQAIQQGKTAEIEQVIAQLLEQDDWQERKTYLHKLQAILAGERDSALAEECEMDYDEVAELKILLEQL